MKKTIAGDRDWTVAPDDADIPLGHGPAVDPAGPVEYSDDGDPFPLAAGGSASTANGSNSPVASTATLADWLINGFWQNYSSSAHHWASNTITFNLGNLNAAEQALALSALNAWHDVANINFVQTSGAANISFNHNGTMQAVTNASWNGAGQMTSATVDISTDWVTTDGGANDGKTGVDSYAYQTYLHEIGHALGLGHQGPYNGSANYSTNAIFANDTWQYSIMSYFSEPNYSGSSYRYVITPQMADIYAVALMYGAATTTRADATVYGFNNNAGSIYNFASYTQAPALTIFDSGGIDTLDCSGYHNNQAIDLRAGSFSSVGGLINNVGIALNTIIENAIGGAGSDTLVGNSVANVLSGGAGNNTMDGGVGSDTVDYSNAPSGVVVNLFSGSASNGFGGTDALISIENVKGSSFSDTFVSDGNANDFSGGAGVDTVSYANSATGVIVDLGSQLTWDGAVNDSLSSIENAIGSSSADTFFSNQSANRISGGAGTDTVSYIQSGTAVIIDLGSQLTWDGNVNDSLSSIENAVGSRFDDQIWGDGSDNVLDGGSGGADTIRGGNGNDTVSYVNSAAGVVIDLATQSTWDGKATDLLSSIENATGSSYDDTLLSNALANRLDGGLGVDTISYSHSTSAVIVDLGSQLTWDGFVNDRLSSVENAIGSEFADQLWGNAFANVLDGGSGADTLSGGAGNDTFIFRKGQTNGDIVTDFNGNGASIGDKLQFIGYGSVQDGASLTQIDATHWSVNSADGLVHDVITLANGASVHSSDFVFV